jgi:hypothetical protein
MPRQSAKKQPEVPAAEPISAAGIAISEPKRKSRFGADLTASDFWKFTAQYPRTPTTEFQLYRKYPVIDRRLTNQAKKTIAQEPDMTEKWVLDNWGTGQYRVLFLDHSLRHPPICNSVLKFDIDWDRPPVFDPLELVEGLPENKGFVEQLKVRGLWKKGDAEQDMAEQNGAAAAAVQEIAGIAKTVISDAQRPKTAEVAERSAIEIMGTAYKAAAQTIAETRPAGAGTSDAVLQILISRMDQQHEMMMKLLDRDRAGGGQVNMQEQLGVVKSFLDFAKGLQPRSAAPASWLDRVGEFIPALLPALMRAGDGLPPGLEARPAQSPIPITAGVQTETTQEDLQKMGLSPTLLPYVRIGRRAFEVYQQKFSGAAFAENVEKVDGTEMYGSLVAIGREAIVNVLQSLPAALLPAGASQIVGTPEFAAWLDDFVAYARADEVPDSAAAAAPDPKGEAA